jgi:hypothetical protein
MKYLISISILLLAANTVSSQPLTRADIVGTWFVDGSVMNPGSMELDSLQKKKLEDMNRAFMYAEFIFDHDSSLQISFKKDTPEIMSDMIKQTTQEWRYNEGISKVSLTSAEKSDMTIKVERVKDKILFVLEETPFILVMTKM